MDILKFRSIKQVLSAWNLKYNGFPSQNKVESWIQDIAGNDDIPVQQHVREEFARVMRERTHGFRGTTDCIEDWYESDAEE